MQPKMLIDVDGPLADFVEATRRGLNGTWTHKDVTAWNFSGCTGFDMPAAEKLWASEGFCANIPITPGAVEGVCALASIGDIYYVTSPTENAPHWMWERSQWLAKHFPPGPVIFTRDKSIVTGDFLIEDNPKHLAAWDWGIRICWDTPYNRGAICERKASSWHAVVTIVELAIKLGSLSGEESREA
jgi:5'(3')-deoxyribonucleotidase